MFHHLLTPSQAIPKLGPADNWILFQSQLLCPNLPTPTIINNVPHHRNNNRGVHMLKMPPMMITIIPALSPPNWHLSTMLPHSPHLEADLQSMSFSMYQELLLASRMMFFTNYLSTLHSPTHSHRLHEDSMKTPCGLPVDSVRNPRGLHI